MYIAVDIRCVQFTESRGLCVDGGLGNAQFLRTKNAAMDFLEVFLFVVFLKKWSDADE